MVFIRLSARTYLFGVHKYRSHSLQSGAVLRKTSSSARSYTAWYTGNSRKSHPSKTKTRQANAGQRSLPQLGLVDVDWAKDLVSQRDEEEWKKAKEKLKRTGKRAASKLAAAEKKRGIEARRAAKLSRRQIAQPPPSIEPALIDPALFTS
ncbi:MAG: hypothetical protein M1829_002713 [Trizodia sp. TS-e1964]|nr:MAG: hypothetical protein M1829_002713 [Trizodia sp. TS-e1964]